MNTNETVIVYAKRSAIAKLMGGLSSTPAPRISAPIIQDALKTTGIKPEAVDEIIMGQVLSAGVGQAPARQAAIYGGLTTSTCATTINRVCGSGLKSIMLAHQSIALGDSEVVVAGGQENMSLAPHLLMNSRSGYKFGGTELKDHMQYDGLWDPYDNMAMGNCGEICAEKYGFTREQQDAFAIESYERSRKASESGHFKHEIVPIEIKKRRETISFAQDEEPFSVKLEKVPALRPAFKKDGTVTAANASSINDGAAITLMMSASKAKELGLTPIAKIKATASYAHEPSWFTTAPINCIKKVLQKAGLKTDDIHHYEINEAFSVVTMAAIQDLKLDPKKVNPFGGAVSLGHPIGASGTRLFVTMLNGLKQTGGKYGLTTLCIGGGEASAVIVEMI